MLSALALLAGVLLPCWGTFPQFKGQLTKMNGALCSHHSECYSDCCLLDFNRGDTFCAPKARRAMECLPQTKGATNILCPCQLGLHCISKSTGCPPQCHLF
ncbi:colipase-like protein 2 [Molossus nigricans]